MLDLIGLEKLLKRNHRFKYYEAAQSNAYKYCKSLVLETHGDAPWPLCCVLSTNSITFFLNSYEQILYLEQNFNIDAFQLAKLSGVVHSWPTDSSSHSSAGISRDSSDSVWKQDALPSGVLVHHSASLIFIDPQLLSAKVDKITNSIFKLLLFTVYFLL